MEEIYGKVYTGDSLLATVPVTYLQFLNYGFWDSLFPI